MGTCFSQAVPSAREVPRSCGPGVASTRTRLGANHHGRNHADHPAREKFGMPGRRFLHVWAVAVSLILLLTPRTSISTLLSPQLPARDGSVQSCRTMVSLGTFRSNAK